MDKLAEHWPEYLIEAALLGTFMVAACAVVALVRHPHSALSSKLRGPLAQRAAIGLAMGATAVLLITSPLGRRSGAHMNPATTLAFLSLGKIAAVDAIFYIVAQFLGASAGVGLCRLVTPRYVAHETVDHAATKPGPRGARLAWIAEFVITFLLFLTVLVLSNRADTMAFTPYAVGALVALYIIFEAPISGMSMNPARTAGSALFASSRPALWVYFTAPPAGMVLASVLYVSILGGDQVYCAKLDHAGDHRCIFHCRISELLEKP